MMIYAIRWLWYSIRLTLHNLFAFLRLMSRTSSRIVIVVCIIAAAIVMRERLHAIGMELIHDWDAGYEPETFLLDAFAVIATVLACFAYAMASGLVKLMVIPFRVGMRPLPPMRKLKGSEAKISSAMVKIVVPPLPKRMKV